MSHVRGADSGAVALDLLRRSGDVDVVISDLMMEGVDGVSFLIVLSQLPQPPVVILTSALDRSIVDSVEQMGCGLGWYMAGQLAKPASQDQLVQRLGQALARPGTAQGSGWQLTELASLADIRRGLAGNEFLPYYQARVAPAGHPCLGVEVLAYWQHPEQSLLPLAEFRPLLEHAGLEEELLWQLLPTAFSGVQHWAKQGLLVPLSIDVSMRSLRDTAFPDQLSDVAAAAGFATEMLTLEFPASASLTDRTATLEICARLRMKGFGLALDNFGTGNHQLEVLARLPFDELKIERHLIPDEPGEKIELLLGSLIDMGKKLSIRTVVDGIETEQDLVAVQQLRPDAMQGNIIASTLPAEALLRW